MRKLLLFSVIVLFAIGLRAQPGTISLNLDAGYNFPSTVKFDVATAKPQGAFQWGGGLEYFTMWDQSIELKYLRSYSDINLDIPQGTKDVTCGSMNYILLGWNKYFGPDPEAKALPFGGLGLGMNIMNINDNSSTKFSWDAKVGVKIKTSSAISIKLQGYLQHTISAAGTDIWYGWYGAYPVTDYASLWQFGLGGVLCFDFQRK